MFLFSKRAKRVVKYAWGGFSVLIILSMVITYSGFTGVARTQAPTTIPPEVLDELNQQRAERMTPEPQTSLDGTRVASTTASSTQAATPTTTTERLKFSL